MSKSEQGICDTRGSEDSGVTACKRLRHWLIMIEWKFEAQGCGRVGFHGRHGTWRLLAAVAATCSCGSFSELGEQVDFQTSPE